MNMKTLGVAAVLCLYVLPAFAQTETKQPISPTPPGVAHPLTSPVPAPTTANTPAASTPATTSSGTTFMTSPGHTFADFRQRLLQGMDNRITSLQQREQCIRGARDLVTLSACPSAPDTNCLPPPK